MLLAAAPPRAWKERTVLTRLRDQLTGLGIRDVTVIARPDAAVPRARVSNDMVGDLRALAELAEDGAGDLVIAEADVIVGRDALAGLLAQPTAALIGARPDAPGVVVSHGRVVAAASSYHRVARPSAASLGVLKVAAGDRAALAVAARRLTELEAPDADVTAMLLVGLVRTGVSVRAADLRAHFWARPRTEAELERAQEAHARYDPERGRMDSAVKASDGFFTTFLVSPYSRYVARWAARRGLTPNLVTGVSFGLGLLAAAAFATGQRAGLIAGAVLLQVSFAADCVDGQLARYARAFSPFGSWLDSMLDRAKEYAVYAGLAIGGSGNVWVLAAAALGLQASRHMLELAWTVVQLRALDDHVHPPLDEPGDDVHGVPRAPSGSVVTWLKKMIVFPIGERFAAISLTAAIFGPRTTFVVLLVWGGVAAAYSIAGRLARSLP